MSRYGLRTGDCVEDEGGTAAAQAQPFSWLLFDRVECPSRLRRLRSQGAFRSDSGRYSKRAIELTFVFVYFGRFAFRLNPWRGATPAFAAWADRMESPRLLERCEKAAGR